MIGEHIASGFPRALEGTVAGKDPLSFVNFSAKTTLVGHDSTHWQDSVTLLFLKFSKP